MLGSIIHLDRKARNKNSLLVGERTVFGLRRREVLVGVALGTLQRMVFGWGNYGKMERRATETFIFFFLSAILGIEIDPW